MSTSAPRGTTVDILVVGPFQENAFFLRRPDGDEVVLVDPGAEAGRIAAVIDAHGWRPVAILNTHGHLDHIGAVAELKRLYRVPFLLHPRERSVLERAAADAREFGWPAPEVPRIDGDLRPGVSLTLAGCPIEVRFTPGHTPGSVSLVTDGRVFTGDALFCGSIGRTDLPGGDTSRLLASIRAELLTLPDDTVVHSGHGPDTTVGRERRHNPFLVEAARREGPGPPPRTGSSGASTWRDR